MTKKMPNKKRAKREAVICKLRPNQDEFSNITTASSFAETEVLLCVFFWEGVGKGWKWINTYSEQFYVATPEICNIIVNMADVNQHG